MLRRALWRGTVLAEADRTLLVEGNLYFPPDAVRWEHLVDSPKTTWCSWKGRARYLSIAVDDEIVADAAWYYPRPWTLARRLRCHVAFGSDVELTEAAREGANGRSEHLAAPIGLPALNVRCIRSLTSCRRPR